MGRDDFPKKTSGDLQEGERGHDKKSCQKQLAMAAIREHEMVLGFRLNCALWGLWQPWRRRRKPELCFWYLLAMWPRLGEELGPRESE